MLPNRTALCIALFTAVTFASTTSPHLDPDSAGPPDHLWQECYCFEEDPAKRELCPWKKMASEGKAAEGKVPPPSYFNGGLLVLVPNAKEHAAMLKALGGAPASRTFR